MMILQILLSRFDLLHLLLYSEHGFRGDSAYVNNSPCEGICSKVKG